MKKVVFLGGTSFSGSTFFHMVLANDPHGFAVGEAEWVFNPRKDNHVNLTCTCGEEPCSVWGKVRTKREDTIFETVFDNYPDVEFIVSSSKNPFWIAKQSAQLRKRGIDTRHLVIWKTPLEFAQSSHRRQKFYKWERSWLSYHRVFATLFPDWRAVKYSEVAKTDRENTLRDTCDYLGIPYFDGKVNYWDKTFHVLSGNTSARFHLYEKKDAENIVKNYDNERSQFYRSIYYRETKDDFVQTAVEGAIQAEPMFSAVEKMLITHSVSKNAKHNVVADDVTYPFHEVFARRTKDVLMRLKGRYTYRQELANSREQAVKMQHIPSQ